MTEKEFIEREEARNALLFITNDTTCPLHIAAEIEQILDLIPATDVVEVVRCKDCKHYVNHDLCYCRNKKGLTDIVKPDDFCSYGKRKENDNG